MPHKLDTDTSVYFYEQEFYVLSNFSAFRLSWRAIDFDTSEHAYQWEKFRHVEQNDPSHIFCLRCDVQDQIQRARSAHAAFKLAEAHVAMVQPCWPAIRVAVMRTILTTKVHQHEYVRRKLFETGDRILIEDSFRDAWWGWGPEKNGVNMLGKLWMDIRDELRKKEQTSASPAPLA